MVNPNRYKQGAAPKEDSTTKRINAAALMSVLSVKLGKGGSYSGLASHRGSAFYILVRVHLKQNKTCDLQRRCWAVIITSSSWHEHWSTLGSKCGLIYLKAEFIEQVYISSNTGGCNRSVICWVGWVDKPSPAPPSFSPDLPALRLLRLCRGGCVVACCSHPPPPQSCYKHKQTNINTTFTSRKLSSLCRGGCVRGAVTFMCSIFLYWKCPVLCSLGGRLKPWIIETLLKLQWEDTSIIKRTGGNIVCTLYLSIRHALLTALSAFYSINGETRVW